MRVCRPGFRFASSGLRLLAKLFWVTAMNQVPEYKERYCAFVDILGFRQLVERLKEGTTPFDALRDLLKRVHSAHSGTALDVHDTDFRAQSISDAVSISTNANAYGLLEIFRSLQSLALDLLVEGFFIRGAVVKAPLYHDDQMVFGEALVKAHYFESEVARFPRIVVSREVREDMIAFCAVVGSKGEYPKMDTLRQSSDGPMYLDVLEPVAILLQKRESLYQTLNADEEVRCGRYLQIKEKIQQRYEEAMDNPRHFEKVRWFARYWNDRMPAKLFLRVRDADRNF